MQRTNYLYTIYIFAAERLILAIERLLEKGAGT